MSILMSWLWYCAIVLQDVTIGGNVLKGSLCVISYNYMWIYNYLKKFFKFNFKILREGRGGMFMHWKNMNSFWGKWSLTWPESPLRIFRCLWDWWSRIYDSNLLYDVAFITCVPLSGCRNKKNKKKNRWLDLFRIQVSPNRCNNKKWRTVFLKSICPCSCLGLESCCDSLSYRQHVLILIVRSPFSPSYHFIHC